MQHVLPRCGKQPTGDTAHPARQQSTVHRDTQQYQLEFVAILSLPIRSVLQTAEGSTKEKKEPAYRKWELHKRFYQDKLMLSVSKHSLQTAFRAGITPSCTEFLPSNSVHTLGGREKHSFPASSSPWEAHSPELQDPQPSPALLPSNTAKDRALPLCSSPTLKIQKADRQRTTYSCF